MHSPDLDPRQSAALACWLAIVGIGEDGIDGLSSAARDAIQNAEFVFGGARHLALAGPLIRGEARAWPTPFDHAVEKVLAERGRRVCVLASGDPFHHGIGPLLARCLHPGEWIGIPSVSAFSLAAARLGWSLADAALVSVHGRALERIFPHLFEAARLLVLTSERNSPAKLADLLVRLGFGSSHLSVLECLGGPRERIRMCRADQFALEDIDPLHVLALEVHADTGARVIARVPGLPDKLFENDGQITKREVRAVALSSLAPRRQELLWDIGAGAGSISIEWMLADVSLRAIAIEALPERAARVRRNAFLLGVPELVVIEGQAPEALDGLPSPAAVFIGGGASDAGVLERASAALSRGGRLVAHAVTLETEAILLAAHATLGGDLMRFDIQHAAALGSFRTWRPALPITQWCWTKP